MRVQRALPVPGFDQVDPFLLLDHFGPIDYGPGEAKGVPDHPHRGFEVISYLLDGAVLHHDSQGHSGRLGPGDMQWMVAGSGVIHSEMPDPALLKNGGRVQGFQLWVNLPSHDKLMPPAYRDIPAASIPMAISADRQAVARVLAGHALGKKAAVQTRTPADIVHYSLKPEARLTHVVGQSANVLVYVFAGKVTIGQSPIAAAQFTVLKHDGENVEIVAENGAELLLLAGEPLNEPIARYGPFVMNTQAEIRQAIGDYRAGRMG